MQPSQTQRSSLKEKQRQERENLILQIAEEVFLEKGYHETSMDEIAARVGIAKGTVYLHFPSKEALVVAIFTRDVLKFSVAVDEAITSPTNVTARAKLEEIIHSMYSSYYSKLAHLLYTIYHSPDLRHTFMEEKGRIDGIWEGIAARVTAVLEEGKTAGEFDPTIPTKVMLSVFFSLLSPRSYERLMGDKQMSTDELVGYLGRVFFGGVTAK